MIRAEFKTLAAVQVETLLVGKHYFDSLSSPTASLYTPILGDCDMTRLVKQGFLPAFIEISLIIINVPIDIRRAFQDLRPLCHFSDAGIPQFHLLVYISFFASASLLGLPDGFLISYSVGSSG